MREKSILSNTDVTGTETIRLEIVMVVNLLLVIICNCTGVLSTRPNVKDAEVKAECKVECEVESILSCSGIELQTDSFPWKVSLGS
jgi:hypothetical protein